MYYLTHLTWTEDNNEYFPKLYVHSCTYRGFTMWNIADYIRTKFRSISIVWIEHHYNLVIICCAAPYLLALLITSTAPHIFSLQIIKLLPFTKSSLVVIVTLVIWLKWCSREWTVWVASEKAKGKGFINSSRFVDASLTMCINCMCTASYAETAERVEYVPSVVLSNLPIINGNKIKLTGYFWDFAVCRLAKYKRRMTLIFLCQALSHVQKISSVFCFLWSVIREDTR